jgi:DNA-binding MarR family transcriptional regulator
LPKLTPRATSPTKLELIQKVSWLALNLAERIQDRFVRHAGDLGLTGAQAKALLALQPGETLPTRALAERMHADPSNFTALIDKLEERGAVERRPDPTDRRIKMLQLTASGLRLREEFWNALTADTELLAHLNVEELRGLLALLEVAVGPTRRGSRAADA